MVMKHLRRYIRNLLIEAMVSPSSLGDDFAILSNYEYVDYEKSFILYNMTKARKDLVRDKQAFKNDLKDNIPEILYNSIDENVVAILTVIPNDGECNSAWTVVRAAAESGYGPTLYDLVMGKSPNGLISDRASVSKSAEKVWKYYNTQRSDLDSVKYLDDTNAPVTNFGEDDCPVHSRFGNHQSQISQAASYIAEEWLHDNYPDDLDELRRQLDNDGEDLYSYRFDEIVEKAAQLSDDPLVWTEWEDFWAENEQDLYALHEPSDPSSKEALDFSYNHSQHAGIFERLITNHTDFFDHAGSIGLNPYEDGNWDPDNLDFIASDFFKGKY